MLRTESAGTDREGRPLQPRAENFGPGKYLRAFRLLHNWIEDNLDIYKPELERVQWPIFVHSLLGLANGHFQRDGEVFFNTYKWMFTPEHDDELRQLETMREPEQTAESPVAQRFQGSKYRLSLTSVAYFNLLQFLESKERQGGSVIIHILQTYCSIITVSRSTAEAQNLAAVIQRAARDRGMPAEDEGIPGHHPGSANTSENAPAVLPRLKLGPLPMEPELMIDVQIELEEEDAKNPPREGQNSLVEEFEKYIKQEPNDDAPSRTDVPLPPSKQRDVDMEVQKVKEHRDRFRIEGRTGGVAPAVSIVMYTFHSTYDRINCLDFSDDNTMVAAGTSDSYIRVWSMDGSVLPCIKPPGPNEPPPSSTRQLIGHAGPVFAVSFSPSAANPDPKEGYLPTTPRYLLSSSADKSVRLWSVDLWHCLMIYKGHDDPVWDVTWGPFGHYFLTGGRDKVARLWSTKHASYLRMFVGHEADVDTVCFHPNCAYVLTGSSDKTVRMWSVTTGNAVRLFTGHTANLTSMACSPDGKTLASADEYGVILLWDLASGRRIKRMRGHGKGGIWALSWSVESTVLVSCGHDGTVRVWNVALTNNDAPATTASSHVQHQQQSLSALANAMTINEASTNATQPATGAAGAAAGQATTAAAAAQSSSTPSGTAAEAATAAAGVTGTTGAGKRKKDRGVVVTPDQISAFPTKQSPVYKVKFTRMNLVIAGGAFRP
ncbi:MAG: Transcription initiation factor TFIID subunit 5 [Peltula sp. TS41687]|nr:MAG: Transcription initiation factor TFIID subunit 5 [Peltula sp. TS41687]